MCPFGGTPIPGALHTSLKTLVIHLTPTPQCAMRSSKSYSKSYFIEVAYRDASTGWQWMKQQVIRSMESQQQVIRSMESHPRTHPKRAKTVSADAKRAQALTAKIDIRIADDLGQTPQEYLHQSVLLISATKKHHLTPTSSTNSSPASMPTK